MSGKGKVILDEYPIVLVEDLDDYWDAMEAEAKMFGRWRSPLQETSMEYDYCYNDTVFTEMVQCADGHVFCSMCVQQNVESMIGGIQSGGNPICMYMGGCTKGLPWAQVQRAILAKTYTKYEQRIAEMEVAQANIEGLVYCPFYKTLWKLDDGLSVLCCENNTCNKTSCVKCKGPHHLDVDCSEVDKVSETALRLKVEEEMTTAFIWECSKCHAKITKTYGCNKMTCKCKEHMCYLCRTHKRIKGIPCSEAGCSRCTLYGEEDPVKAVQDAKDATIALIKEWGGVIHGRDVGPSDFMNHEAKKRQNNSPCG